MFGEKIAAAPEPLWQTKPRELVPAPEEARSVETMQVAPARLSRAPGFACCHCSSSAGTCLIAYVQETSVASTVQVVPLERIPFTFDE